MVQQWSFKTFGSGSGTNGQKDRPRNAKQLQFSLIFPCWLRVLNKITWNQWPGKLGVC